MAADLFTLKGSVDLDIDRVMRGLNSVDTQVKNTQKSTLSFSQGFTALGNGMASLGTKMSLFVTAPLMALGKVGIDTASDLKEVQNVVDTAFKGSADEVNKWSKTTLEAFGLTELQAKNWAGTMRSMIGSMGLSGKEADSMSMKLAELAGDMASFYNLPHDQAWEKIRSGIAGETEPLKALGINMSVANMEAYALAQGLSKPWKEMSQSEQTILRYNYLMELTKDVQGDFSKTSDSFSNQLRVVKGQFQSIAGELMKGFLPTLEQGLTKVKEFSNWFMTLSDEQKMFIAKIGIFVAALGPMLMILGNLVTVITGVVTGIGALGGIVAIITSPVTLVIAAIAGLIAILAGLWKTNDEFRNACITCWESIKAFGVQVFESLKWFWQEWGDEITLWWNACWDNIGIVFTTVVNLISSLFKFFTSLLKGDWEGCKNALLEYAKALYEGLGNWFKNIYDFVSQIFGQLVTWLGTKFTEMKDSAIAKVNEMVTNVIEWFKQLPYNIGVFVGQMIAHILQFGLDCKNWITTELPQIINNIINWFATLPSRIKEWLIQSINNVIQWGIDLASRGREASSQMVSDIVNTISSLPSRFIQTGKDIVRGLADGIMSMVGWIKDKISSFASGILDGFKSVFDIHSPSRVMRDQIGKMMSEGIGVGFTMEQDNLNRDIKRSLSNTIDFTKDITTQSNNETIINPSLDNSLLILELKELKEVVRALKLSFNIDSRELTEYGVAPNQDILENYNKLRFS